jgi:hypothetical protein
VLFQYDTMREICPLKAGKINNLNFFDPLLSVIYGPLNFNSAKTYLLCPSEPIGEAHWNIPESTMEYELSQHIAQPVDPALKGGTSLKGILVRPYNSTYFVLRWSQSL